MIFLTVGTQFPFDRLVKAVDEAVERGFIKDEIYAQIGKSHYKPRNFDYVELLQKEQFDDYVRNSTYLISHAGMGIITIALEYNRPLLVMPRCKKHNEVVNDHQVAIAKKFEECGYVLVAYDTNGLQEGVRKLMCFVPRQRMANPAAVADRIRCFINNLQDSMARGK
jgi:UDP-N-acetylglucosamine transferase subunit ALG13